MKGFTLIELLIVIAIIGILVTLSLFGLQGARENARDSKRKADLELIRSGLEIYRTDCLDYPPSLVSPLVGDGLPTTCPATNTYIESQPVDPLSPDRAYFYSRPSAVTYMICASLEEAPNPAVDVSGCGSCGGTSCNYKVTNP